MGFSASNPEKVPMPKMGILYPLFSSTKTHSICSSFKLLADESRDLSQTENKITVVKVEPIQKMHNHFYSNRSKIVILSENSWHFVNLLRFDNNYFLLSLRYITWFISQQIKAWTNGVDQRQILLVLLLAASLLILLWIDKNIWSTNTFSGKAKLLQVKPRPFECMSFFDK